MLVLLWAAARWLEAGRGDGGPAGGAWRWLGVAFAATAGTMLFHSVVGLSVIPVTLGACAVHAVLGRRGAVPQRSSAPWALAAAVTAGMLVTLPYFRSIVSGWGAGQTGVRHEYLHVGWRLPWTLLTASGLAGAAAWLGLRRALREPHAAAPWLATWAAGMTAFACVVHLPQNNEHKFVWQVFVPLAVLGGAGLPTLAGAARRRLGTPIAAVLGFFAFVAPSLLFLDGYLRDPSGRTAFETHRGPGERELYAWVRARTPVNATFADHHARDVLLVEGRRRLVVGTARAPDTAGFPGDQMAHRRAVLSDLYGPVARPEADAACLDSLGTPVYVLYRPQDFSQDAPWSALEADSTWFERVYADSVGHRVFRVRPR